MCVILSYNCLRERTSGFKSCLADVHTDTLLVGDSFDTCGEKGANTLGVMPWNVDFEITMRLCGRRHGGMGEYLHSATAELRECLGACDRLFDASRRQNTFALDHRDRDRPGKHPAFNSSAFFSLLATLLLPAKRKLRPTTNVRGERDCWAV